MNVITKKWRDKSLYEIDKSLDKLWRELSNNLLNKRVCGCVTSYLGCMISLILGGYDVIECDESTMMIDHDEVEGS